MSNPSTPPRPEGWNKTFDDLAAEVRQGLRSSLGSPEVEWAQDYERSLLPAGTRFPKQGDVYAANEDVPVTLYLSWRLPFTSDMPYTLPGGCRLRIESDGGDRPLAVNALPVDYEATEKAALSVWIRFRPGYGGYHLTLHTRDILKSFSLVSSGP